jgi:hypothetical protein
MPFSWELVLTRQQSVLVGLQAANPGLVSIDWALSFANMERPPIWDVMRVSGLGFGEGRTQMAYQCLNGGYEFLFMLDCDVLAPKNTIPRLLSHRLPIVSGLYFQRFPSWSGVSADYNPCAFNEVVDGQGNVGKQPIANYAPGSLVECHYVPGGCLLVHRSVFQRMLDAGIKRFFEWTLHADSPPGVGKSEDFEFCSRARALGYKIYVSSDLVCTHETSSQVTSKGLLPKL